MQYYVKIFNEKTGDLVGYYKETGKSCISKLLNGARFFNTLEEARAVAEELDGGFVRDTDKHYYTSATCVYCDSKREPKLGYISKKQKEVFFF